MKKRRVTSRDVARQAGVSQTTVSFVLNNVADANISADTAARVRQVAEDLGYVPDVNARALVRGTRSTIGLVLTKPHAQIFIDEYIPRLITGIMRALRPRAFHLLLEEVNTVAQLHTFRALARGGEVAGLIIPTYNPLQADIDALQLLAHDGFPIVTTDRLNERIPNVATDHLGGVRLGVRHLIALGHTHFACISYAPHSPHEHAERRIDAFRDELRTHGLPIDERLIRRGAYDPETGYTAMQDILRIAPAATALVALNDVMAFGAMTAIQEAGLRVPDDIAVVGYDDMRMAAYTSPPLTTLRAPDIQQGYAAAEMLLRLIDGETLPEAHITLHSELVVRGSCGAQRPEREGLAPMS